jgi:hypothetical protein
MTAPPSASRAESSVAVVLDLANDGRAGHRVIILRTTVYVL